MADTQHWGWYRRRNSFLSVHKFQFMWLYLMYALPGYDFVFIYWTPEEIWTAFEALRHFPRILLLNWVYLPRNTENIWRSLDFFIFLMFYFLPYRLVRILNKSWRSLFYRRYYCSTQELDVVRYYVKL